MEAEMKLRINATDLRPGDVLHSGKIVESRIAIDASATPKLMLKLGCLELAAVRFLGEPLHVLFSDKVKFIIERKEKE
jgi:hypothetical protein